MACGNEVLYGCMFVSSIREDLMSEIYLCCAKRMDEAVGVFYIEASKPIFSGFHRITDALLIQFISIS